MSTNKNFTNGNGSFVLFEKGTAANIPPNFGNGSEYTDGKIYFDTDNSKLYIDADRKQGTAMVQKRHLIAGNSIVDISATDNNGDATISYLDGREPVKRKLGYTAGSGITINNHQISANQANADKTDTSKPNKVWKTDGNGVPGWRDDTNTWKRNTQDQEGYVTAPKDTNGNYLTNKVWKTNGSGVPGWRDDSSTAYTAGTGISISNGQISCTPNTKDQNGYVTAPKDANNNYLTNKVWKTNGSGVPGWRDDADTTYSIIGTSTATGSGLLIPAPPTNISSTKAKYTVLNALGKWVGLGTNDNDTITSKEFFDNIALPSSHQYAGTVYGHQLTVRYPGELVGTNTGSASLNFCPQVAFIDFHINATEHQISQASQDGRVFWKCGLPRHFSSVSGVTGGGWSTWVHEQGQIAMNDHSRPLDVSFRYDSGGGNNNGEVTVIYLDIFLDQSQEPFTGDNLIIDLAFIVIGTHDTW